MMLQVGQLGLNVPDYFRQFEQGESSTRRSAAEIIHGSAVDDNDSSRFHSGV